MHILHVAGARPNFMKVAPVIAAFNARGVQQTLVHTGQHYDPALSDIFFEQLGIPKPDVCLGVGSGSHAVQTAQVMQKFDETVTERKPDWVFVYGDINSSVAACMVSAKRGIATAHVEAGLRSFDRAMPEELNRLVIDQLSNLLLTPSPEADVNLQNEGVPAERIRLVGNVMIDTVLRLSEQATLPAGIEIDTDKPFAFLTMHRPSNVDCPQMLTRLMNTLSDISERLPIVFPVHPRTKVRIEAAGLNRLQSDRFQFLDPIGYLECVALQKSASVVLTDSGGLQEESTALGTPCLTIRENTERPITIDEGTNILVGTNTDLMQREVDRILRGEGKQGRRPELWDGRASERIADVILTGEQKAAA